MNHTQNLLKRKVEILYLECGPSVGPRSNSICKVSYWFFLFLDLRHLSLIASKVIASFQVLKIHNPIAIF